MSAPCWKLPLALPVLALAAATAWAQVPSAAGGAGAAAAGEEEVTESWSVGVCVFSAEGLPAEEAYLTRSLPQLIRERLTSIPTHTLSPEQASGLRAQELARERRGLAAQLGTARAERDALLFQGLQEEELERRRAELGERIDRLEQALRGLMAPGTDAAADGTVEGAGEELPVEFLQGEEEGGLLPPPAFSPLRFARQQGADLLIHGQLQPLQEYLFLEVRALDSAAEREVYSYRDAVQREEIYSLLGEVIDRLAEVVLGRMWSGLAIPGLPEGCEVWLDGRFVGTGVERHLYLSPGEHTVRLLCPQGREQVSRVTLEPGQVAELPLDLRERAPDRIRLVSQPTGAQVYAGSLFLGSTPLELDRPALKTRLLLRLDGWGDTVLYLDPGAPAALEVPLEPLIANPAALQSRGRDRFYRSFGLWALSFPLPFFLYAATVDYAIAAQTASVNGDSAEAARLARSGRLTYYSYLGSLGLSVGLFANVAVQLWRYVRSADRKAH